MADTPKRARFYEKRRVEGRKPAKSIAIEVEKGHEARLTNLMDSWRKARDGFVVKGDTKTGNADFLEHLLDMYRKSHETDGLTLLANVANTPRPTAHPNFAKNLHTAANHEDELFITTKSCLSTMLAELGACPALKGDRGDTCGGELSIKEMDRYGHVIVATITCPKKHTWKWHSSSSVGGKYYVNQRVVHAFTSTGMAPVKYETFCEAAKLGVNGEAYVKNMYEKRGYTALVDKHAAASMEQACRQAEQTEFFQQNNGEGNHEQCHAGSPCQSSVWRPRKVLLKDPDAIEAYTKFLKSTEVYKRAEHYIMVLDPYLYLVVECRDTYMVESFNNVILIYAPKRVHFGDSVFNMRVQLAVLDWNTNVLRDTYCVKHYQDIRRPSRIAPMRVLKPKDTSFRDNIWRDFYNLHY
ncbi:Orexin receptor type 2 [Branchiostoma belcheri]|nr:Orexin receptor type 2 [Branchiostoma belcheri]